MKALFIFLLLCLSSSILFAQSLLENEQYMNAYIIVVDTNQDYFQLRDEMFALREKFYIEIDTMGRTYDDAKNLICLPDDNEDDLYAGNYFVRRFPSKALSLEYLKYYVSKLPTEDNTIALVALITDKKQEAEEYLSSIIPLAKNSRIVEAKLYMGCMH